MALPAKPPKNEDLLMCFYEAMYSRFGHRNWWPAESPFEVCVGAILTQNTSWKNVTKAIENLKAAAVLEPLEIYRLSVEQLAELIRPSGYYNIKAARLKNFVAVLVEKYRADLTALFSESMAELRPILLSISGIGKETADSMILYGAKLPVFVVDAYTKRVLFRHRVISEREDYDGIQKLFHGRLPRDAALFNDFHAQFVAVGHHYCKKIPQCRQCPLRELLPEDQAKVFIEVEKGKKR